MLTETREIAPDQNSAPKAVALTVSSIAVFMIAFMIPALNVALPAIGKEFGSDAIVLGWMVTAYVVGIAVFSIPFGRMSDILGIKKVFVAGLIVYTLASTLIALSNSSFMIIAGRALQGAGAAMVLVNSLAMITAIYPAHERGRALGISLSCIFVGAAAGPFLGGLVTEHLGWRSVFLTNIPVGLLLIVLLTSKIRRDWSESKGEKFDYLGSLIYGLALVALMYGFSILPEWRGGILIAAGVVLLLGFFKWESRTESPALNVAIFKNNRTFVFSCLAALAYFCATSAMIFLVSLYLQYIQGLTPQMAGLVLMAQPVVQAFLSPFTGRLSDKIEPRIVATWGMALTCLGLFAFIFLSNSTSLVQIIITLVVLGAGFAFFLSPNTNAIMSSVTPKYLGVASAAMSTMISLGQMLSMGITMIVIALVIGRVAITPPYYAAFLSSSHYAFVFFTALCFGGIFVSFFRGKLHK